MKRTLLAVLLAAALGLVSACATSQPAGAAAAEPTPQLVSTADDYDLVLKALAKTRRRLEADKARLVQLEGRLAAERRR